MAYLDDVRAERRQWALEAHQTHQASTQQPSRTPTPATSQVHTQAAWLAALGAVGCVTPAAPIGLFLLIVGGGLLLCTPVIERAETAAHQATVAEVKQGTGNGCGAVVTACVLVAVIVLAIVGVAMLAAMGVRP